MKLSEQLSGTCPCCGASWWIDPNYKAQKIFLPNIGEKCLFSHKGTTYYGYHTGGAFKTGQGASTKYFRTWDCVWMPLPAPPETSEE